MNSKELRDLRNKVGDEVLKGFLAESGRCVRCADALYAHYQRQRAARKAEGRPVPPAIMDAFIHLLVAQSFIDEEIGTTPEIGMDVALGILNPMLQATSDTWLRIGWEGETP